MVRPTNVFFQRTESADPKNRNQEKSRKTLIMKICNVKFAQSPSMLPRGSKKGYKAKKSDEKESDL